MGMFGKIVGGTIGFALGGPLGAIAGAAFGHAYDISTDLDGQGTDEQSRISAMEETQLTFFVAAFSMLAKLAKADGQISKPEIDSINHFMTVDLALDAEKRHIAMNIFRAAVDSPESFENFARQFYATFHNQPQLLELMVDILLRVSIANGRMSTIQENLIAQAVRIFTFPESTYHALKSKYVTDSAAYEILGASSEWGDDQLKRQYRKMVSEYHPDKIAAKGLPEEFVKFANDKFREIQEAYDTIKKERGIR